MSNKYKFAVFTIFFLAILTFPYSCKKAKDLDIQKPENPEIFFDHKDDAMGYVVGSRWNKTAITWYVEKWCNSLSESETRDMLKKSFKVWSDASVLTFTEVSSLKK